MSASEQSSTPLDRICPRLRVLVDIERNLDVERTPHANLTRNLNRTAHQFNKRLDDWHAHAGSLELAARIVTFLGKRFIDML